MIRRPRFFRALIPVAAAFLLLGLVNSLDPLEPWQLPEDLEPPDELSLERLGANPLGAPEDEFAALQTGFDLVFSGDYRGGGSSSMSTPSRRPTPRSAPSGSA